MSEDYSEEGLDLSPKQIQFCREYIIDLNATQAYIRAGYSEEGANTNASRLISNDRIQALIARFARDRSTRMQISADQVLSQLSRLAHSDIRRIHDENGNLKRIEDLDDDTAMAIQSVKVTTQKIPGSGRGEDAEYENVIEYKMADKRGAADLLGKHLRLWVERVEHSGRVGGLTHIESEYVDP